MDAPSLSLPKVGARVRWKGQTGTPGGTIVAVDTDTVQVTWHIERWSSTFSRARFVLLCDVLEAV